MNSSQQQKESPTDAFLRDVSTWKLAGVAVWHAGLFLLGGAAWSLPPSTSISTLASALFRSSWFYLLLVYASLVGVLYAQRRVLTTIDVPPLYVAQLGWSSKAWPALLLSRCVLRQRSLASLADVLLFYASCQASAIVGLQLLQPAGSLKAGRQPLWMFGAVLGATYAVVYLIRGKNVLSFPVLQRQRYFRVKQRLPAMCKATLLYSSVALALSIAACWLTRTQPWPSLGAAAAAWRSAALLVWGWSAGAHMLEVVFTERVAMADDSDPAPTGPLLAALQHSDPIVQDWCLQDLTAVAEGAAGCANRRAALFADETGASGWCPLSRYCLTELRDFVGVMASALPAVQSSASSGSGVRWNTLQLSAAGGQAASRAQDLALWHMQARHYRLVWCLRSLSGLAAVGLQLDKFGLLQLSHPNLADVLSTLLGVVLVLRAYVKSTSAIPSRPSSKLAHALSCLLSGSSLSSSSGCGGDGSSSEAAAQHHVDSAALSLLDVAQTCVYRITATYGAVLGSVVAGAVPVVGTAAESCALLQTFLDYEQ